jgi:DNA-damage-inducible protein J
MTSTTTLCGRVDERVKAQASRALARIGMTMSDAVRALLARVVADQQMPFSAKVPNARTRAAMKEADGIVRSRRARFM